MELSDLGSRELDSVHLLRIQSAPSRARHRTNLDTSRFLSVEFERNLGERPPASRSNIIDDIADSLSKLLVGTLLGPSERAATVGVAEPVPVDPLHSIIFSMGTTRMADAPAPFSSRRVSQKTFS